MYRGMDAYNRSHVKDKVLLFPTDTVSGSLKYALDRSEKDLGLPDLTKACLDNFAETAKKGFFMMVRYRSGGTASWKLSQVYSAASTWPQVYPAASHSAQVR